jgi:hypothetical protein
MQDVISSGLFDNAHLFQSSETFVVHVMNASQFNADDITGVKTDNVTGNNPNGQPVVLPFMDSNEINKKLEEHRKMLKEWDELLQRTGDKFSRSTETFCSLHCILTS